VRSMSECIRGALYNALYKSMYSLLILYFKVYRSLYLRVIVCSYTYIHTYTHRHTHSRSITLSGPLKWSKNVYLFCKLQSLQRQFSSRRKYKATNASRGVSFQTLEHWYKKCRRLTTSSPCHCHNVFAIQ